MKAEYLDHMGDDLAVVNAARVSFDKESEWEFECDCVTDQSCIDAGGCDCGCPETARQISDNDASLIKYLAKHNHWTPFAHTSIKLRMSAPVPIRTQCFKHKAGFVENEESRRYIKSTPEIYFPDEWRMAADNVKQGSGGVHPRANQWDCLYSEAAQYCVNIYEDMIQDGICPEQARLILPQGAIVNWIWTGNLSSFARFVNQRTDPHAQKEVRDLANMASDIIAHLFPVSWVALTGASE